MISNNIIADNSADWGAGGIRCITNSSPTIWNNIIEGNTAGDEGGGILCQEYSEPVIQNNTIVLNSTNSGGGGIYSEYSSLTVTDSVIADNICQPNGYGDRFLTKLI